MFLFCFLTFLLIFSSYGRDISKNSLIGETNSLRISFGSNVSLVKHPWQVYLNPCSGVIIAKRYILTAAHCVRFKLPEEIKPQGGGDGTLLNLTDLPAVKKIIKHPNYWPWKRLDEDTENRIGKVKNHDIAILELVDDITFSETIQKINLPDASYSLNDVFSNKAQVFITGWGGTLSKYISENLQEVPITNFLPPAFEIRGWNEEKYKKELSDNIYAPDFDLYQTYLTGNFIGFYFENQQGFCKGDSGGPMVDYDNKILLGICAHTDGYCGTNKYGYYSDVTKYIEWINSVIY